MFNNAGHALEWAYNTSARPIVKMSGINNMRGSGHTTANELLINLTVQDMHGQAALIIGLVDTLYEQNQAEHEYIRAKFGRKFELADIPNLVWRGCEASGLGLRSQNLVYRVMRDSFAGKGMPYRAIRKVLRCSSQQALMTQSCLYEVLDRYHDRAMSDMTEIFERHGLIRSTSSYA